MQTDFATRQKGEQMTDLTGVAKAKPVPSESSLVAESEDKE